jgi:hypothetical protein
LALNELEAEAWKEVELRLLSSFDTLKVKDKKDRGTITIKVTKYGIIVVYFLVFFFLLFIRLVQQLVIIGSYLCPFYCFLILSMNRRRDIFLIVSRTNIVLSIILLYFHL